MALSQYFPIPTRLWRSQSNSSLFPSLFDCDRQSLAAGGQSTTDLAVSCIRTTLFNSDYVQKQTRKAKFDRSPIPSHVPHVSQEPFLQHFWIIHWKFSLYSALQDNTLDQARPTFSLPFEEQPRVFASEGKSDGCAPPRGPFALEGRQGPGSVASRAKSNSRLLVRANPWTGLLQI